MAKMKLKTLSGAKKRFKMTASGKIKRNASKRRHILTKKTTKLTRGLRMPKYVDKTNEAAVKKNDALRWLITKTFKGQLLPVTDKGDIKHGSY